MSLIDRAANDLQNAADRASGLAASLAALAMECQKEAKELRKLADEAKREAAVL